jgi:UDP-N-acetylglucosamine diphosphorylase/glucosamine-1-phosphate N-acetyltransferase
MTAFYLYDDNAARSLEPFALTRPAGELRAGALLTRERWERVLGVPCAGSVSAAHLASFDEAGAAPVVRGELPAGSWLVNARALPRADRASDSGADALAVEHRLAAVRLRDRLHTEVLHEGAASLDGLAVGAPRSLPGWWVEFVWDYIGTLEPMLDADIRSLAAELRPVQPAGCTIIGDHPVFAEADAVIEPHVVFDTRGGPVLVRTLGYVQAFTRLVGPLVVGTHSVVTSDRVAVCSIGDTCKVHGEVSNTIFLGHCNKGHDGFVGHSYLGRWVNLGAQTVTSNLKNTYSQVSLWTPEGERDTGLQFLGTLFGDHAKTGIGTPLTTGTVLGAGANVFGSRMPPKAVAPFSWGEGEPYATYELRKFLEVAERMMARRHVPLTDGARAQLTEAHRMRWTLGEEPGA